MDPEITIGEPILGSLDDMTWEDRVKRLEAENVSLRATVDKLNGVIAAQEAAEAARAQAEVDSYVADLCAQAVAAQSPLDGETVDQIKSLFAAGHAEAARSLGAASLKLAQVTGGGAVGGDEPKTFTLDNTNNSPWAPDAEFLARNPNLAARLAARS